MRERESRRSSEKKEKHKTLLLFLSSTNGFFFEVVNSPSLLSLLSVVVNLQKTSIRFKENVFSIFSALNLPLPLSFNS